MNRRTCINCQTTWGSLADHELDGPHTCPRCGDELAPASSVQTSGQTPLSPAAAR